MNGLVELDYRVGLVMVLFLRSLFVEETKDQVIASRRQFPNLALGRFTRILVDLSRFLKLLIMTIKTPIIHKIAFLTFVLGVYIPT